MVSPFAHVFAARHVAVFGASTTPGKWGYNAVKKLIQGGYQGEITLVNPKGGILFGRPLVPYREAAGAEVAIISTPAPVVPEVISQCGEVGIKVAIVQAGGFREVGNLVLNEKLMRRAREGGVRIIGPNSVGVFVATNRLNMTVMPDLPSGHVAIVSQSGGVAQQGGHRLAELGSGYDVVVALGNKIDLGFGDAIKAISSRATARALLLYLERVDEGEQLLEIVSDVCRDLPVVVLLAGQTQSGRKAAFSHTGSMVDNWGRTAGMLTDAGALVQTRLELALAAVAGCDRGARRPGRRVYVLCDGGGHSVLLAESLERAGFELDIPGEELTTKLGGIVGARASGRNPLDLEGRADRDPAVYSPILHTVLASGAYDAVVVGGMFGGYEVFFDPGLATVEEDAARQIAKLASGTDVPIVFQTIYATDSSRTLAALRDANIACVEWPDEVVAVLQARMISRHRATAAPRSVDVLFHEDLVQLTDRLVRMFDRERIPHAIGHVFPEPPVVRAEATKWVLRLDGFPHKTAVGAIRLGITGAQLPASFRQLVRLAKRNGVPPIIRIAPFVPHQQELIVSFWRDDKLGAGWMVGAGGTNAEHLRDIAVGRLPRNPADVTRILERTREGVAIQKDATRVDAFAELIVRVAKLFEQELRDLHELELNPVAITPERAVILDALPS